MGRTYILIGQDTMAYTMYLRGLGEALLNENIPLKLIEESLDAPTKMQRIYSLNTQNLPHTKYKLNISYKKNLFNRTTNK